MKEKVIRVLVWAVIWGIILVALLYAATRQTERR